MKTCDGRLEVRLPGREKDQTILQARQRKTTVSELTRRALRAYLKLPEPLPPGEALAVVALRRRINALELRIDKGGQAGIANDLARARADAQSLLGR